VTGAETGSGFVTVTGGWGFLILLLAQEEKNKTPAASRKVIARRGVVRFKGASNGQSRFVCYSNSPVVKSKVRATVERPFLSLQNDFYRAVIDQNG
jgi:hypothetical protein